jgi:hypothetical protein
MAKKFDRVRAGDLITDVFVNGLLDYLEALDVRVSGLEQGSGSVAITSLPFGDIRVGQEVHIRGRNFGFSTGQQKVFIDDVPVNAFRFGSDDTELIFTIPAVPNIPSTGKIVVLTIQNASSTDSRTILLLPAVQGIVEISPEGVDTPTPPQPVVAGQLATLKFAITSRAQQTANFLITVGAAMTPPLPSWQNANLFQVLDDQKVPLPASQITLAPDQQKTFYIQITPIPSDTPVNTSINLTVGASAGSVTGGTIATFTIGQAGETPDPSIPVFRFDHAVIPDPTGQSSFNNIANTLRIKTSVKAVVVIAATLTVAGNYNLTFTPSAAQAVAQGWTIDFSDTTLPIIVTPQQLAAQGGQVPESFNISFKPEVNAASTIGINLRIDHNVTAPNSRTIPFTLTRIP